jgi:hypothetical protein
MEDQPLHSMYIYLTHSDSDELESIQTLISHQLPPVLHLSLRHLAPSLHLSSDQLSYLAR